MVKTRSRAVTVTLPSEFDGFIEAQIASGRYRSASDVVRAALELLQKQGAESEPLHARVDDALLSLTRGEGAEGEAYVENPAGELEESQEDERPVQR